MYRSWSDAVRPCKLWGAECLPSASTLVGAFRRSRRSNMRRGRLFPICYPYYASPNVRRRCSINRSTILLRIRLGVDFLDCMYLSPCQCPIGYQQRTPSLFDNQVFRLIASSDSRPLARYVFKMGKKSNKKGGTKAEETVHRGSSGNVSLAFSPLLKRHVSRKVRPLPTLIRDLL